MSIFKGNVDIPDPDNTSLPAEEEAVLDKLAKKAVERGMAVPAILFLESVKPLNFIASQVMVFFEPVIQTIFNFKDYNNLRSALEKRESVEILLLKIEKFDAVALERDKRVKRYMKGIKKDWAWYQKYLGLFRPRVKIPDEIIDPPQETPKRDPSK
ncbi:MAG: hypothetical protein JSU74_12085 [Candidatus Zixiibacteriota bacterium]|nr:MAG: hypothetical protein JSU74_12085 [candidate division Zixibacteria bacterium]